MIPRYSRKDLVNIWTPENKIKIWLNIEILACEAQEKLGNIPKKSLKTIKEKASFEVNRICLLYTSPSPRDATLSRMPSSA